MGRAWKGGADYIIIHTTDTLHAWPSNPHTYSNSGEEIVKVGVVFKNEISSGAWRNPLANVTMEIRKRKEAFARNAD